MTNILKKYIMECEKKPVNPLCFVHTEMCSCANYPGLKVIQLFSCSVQLSMKFFLLINVKMPTVVGILTFMSR